ncbi:MAG: hypothetical protein ACI9KS_002967 [Sulfitobacter sp.]|jgi:hypothetical protein
MPRRYFYLFLRQEDGAVTIDWVVLTAAIMGMSLAVIAIWWDALTTNVGKLNSSIEARTISTTFAQAPVEPPA